ncbi:helix-turn-helix domain-containing protein [Pseudomonas aeruginosa]|uniref:helix-turn-helix domain-containing protein n=1 Tax=Pseudomonas aeruginosa TaxID=287 RepID=UPI000EB289C0|nr:helix-turn-helix transcriptional regulator [Pseudomonas aeruginosa]NTS92533.1 helix-turn-helix transcriptional regulator [Pseudomonas aeruginosa]
MEKIETRIGEALEETIRTIKNHLKGPFPVFHEISIRHPIPLSPERIYTSKTGSDQKQGATFRLTLTPQNLYKTTITTKYKDTKVDHTHAKIYTYALFGVLISNTKKRAPSLFITPDTKLTKRELEILRRSADGQTALSISEKLSLSPHTVNSHINSATRKLRCRNKPQAIALAAILELL